MVASAAPRRGSAGTPSDRGASSRPGLAGLADWLESRLLVAGRPFVMARLCACRRE